ncbi:MAG: SAM-dependent methyltransferase, partial [Clostridiaceae bacterium]|nr:SAM-dependent methyltransferase [Clostridiaceae bacterium]
MSDLVKDGECLDDLQLNGLKIIQKKKGFRF